MFGTEDPFWQADRARVADKKWMLREPGLWAIWIYRFGQRADRRSDGVLKSALLFIYNVLAPIIHVVTGVRIPKGCRIGRGLRIWHFGGIFINENAVIGENCTLRQGVTIGNRQNGDESPIIGDNVEVGVYAQILGSVRIGNNCRIGALTVVIDDMPDNSTAVGQKARIVQKGKPAGF